MKTFRFTLSLILIVLASVAMAATTATAAPVETVTLMSWLKANIVPFLTAALIVSETMASSPWFKGNGILDTFVKFLKLMVEKPGQP